MIESIEREGAKVVIKINSGIGVEKYILPLKWECDDEMFAELLKEKLSQQLDKFKKQNAERIADDCLCYLGPLKISNLKSRLKKWNGTKHCWK